MTVADAQARIDSAEFAEWMAYDQVEPFGPERDDLRAAIICSTVYSCLRGKGSPKMTPKDFMLNFEQPGRQTPEEMMARLDMLTALVNAREERRGKGR